MRRKEAVKMRKRMMSLLLCTLLLCTSLLPAYAADGNTVTISSVEDLLTLAENCRLDSYSVGLTVSLEADLDLEGTDFQPIPSFSGTFLGNGHTISGLTVTAAGSVQGLFRYLTETAQVSDLHVSGTVTPEGSRSQVGGIAGSNAGRITGCSFSGTVSGSSDVGGIAGSNAVTGIIESCSVSGTVSGSHFVGGVCGRSSGVIRSCENQALVNTTAPDNDVSLSDITLEHLADSEAANTATDIGGIVGLSSGVVRSCTNGGNVGYQYMGYNVGGIAGTQSGYLTDCRNQGAIQGRKEVGGIVGQLEPAYLGSYSTDTLQQLQSQFAQMSAAMDRTSANTQNSSQQLTDQMGDLRNQFQTAQDAVEILLPDGDNPTPPDSDTIQAAQNALGSAVQDMTGTMQGMAGTAQGAVTDLQQELQQMADILNDINHTVGSASENLGASFTDVSDADTDVDLTGKVERCVNTGSVLADWNAGGIAGAMAVENDLDVLTDWQISGEVSLNFQGEVRAVVRSCENSGTVTARKEHAGGIVGWQTLGLVKACFNTGSVDASAADYVGGVAGLSSGYIRQSYARCPVTGSTYVGGIAGSAGVVSDCRSMVSLGGASERSGAVAGWADEMADLTGNYYLPINGDAGGVDGVSYDGRAQALSREDFLALPGLPEAFGTVTVRFVAEDGSEEVRTTVPGGSVTDIPAVPEKEGYVGSWEGLTDLSEVVFDLTFHAVYTAEDTTIQSVQTRSDGRPILLLQGTFAPDSEIDLKPLTAPDGEDAANWEGWEITYPSHQAVTAGRILPDDAHADDTVRVLLRQADGTWQPVETQTQGSYLTFALSGTETAVALEYHASLNWIWVVCGGAGLLVLALAGRALQLRRKKK